MKKRILSMLMAMVMVVTMLPTVVLAEEEQSEHICSENDYDTYGICRTCEKHNGNITNWTKLSDWITNDYAYNDNVAHVYLDKDITLNSPIPVGSVKYTYEGDVYDYSKTLYLHLNDKLLTIARNGSNNYNYSIIKSYGTLKIYDSAQTTRYGRWNGSTYEIFNEAPTTGEYNTLVGGVIYGSSATYYSYNHSGGAIDIESGSFTMYGGTVAGNRAYMGGSIYVGSGARAILDRVTIIGNKTSNWDGGGIYNYGTLTMSNCTITNNTSERWGGGIYNGDVGTLMMSGCTIRDNKSKSGGGGIYNQGILEISDGIIKDNTANTAAGSGWQRDGGGIFCEGGTLKLSGNVNITDNKKIKNNGTVDNNVYLYGTNIITIIENSLTNDAQIGVTISPSSPNTFTSGGGECVNNFKSDNPAYNVGKDGINLKLVNAPTYRVTRNNNGNVEGGTFSVNYSAYEKQTVTITVSPADGYEVNTITVYKTGEESSTVDVNEDNEFTMPAYPVTVSVTFKAIVSHSHCICGATHASVGDHDEPVSTTFTRVTTQEDLQTAATSGGSVYLANDIKLTSTITVAGGKALNLCLNDMKLYYEDGGNISIFTLEEGATLNLTDCGTTERPGYVDGDTYLWTPGIAESEDDIPYDLTGGLVTGGTGCKTNPNSGYSYGGAVYANPGSKFNLYGGNIAGNDTTYAGGGVCGENASMAVYGGCMVGNDTGAISIWDLDGYDENFPTLSIYGGELEYNRAPSNIDGEIDVDGPITMTGGTVTAEHSWIAMKSIGNAFTMMGGTVTCKKHFGTAVQFNGNPVYTETQEGNTVYRTDTPAKVTLSDGTINAPSSGYGLALFNGYSDLYLSGTPVLTDNDSDAAIAIYRAEENNTWEDAGNTYVYCCSTGHIVLDGQLSWQDPVLIKVFAEDSNENADPATLDFTSGWNTYMRDADPADYFTSGHYSAEVAKNAQTGELKMAESYYVILSDAETEYGSYNVDKYSAYEGDTVTITATPIAGYEVGRVKVSEFLPGPMSFSITEEQGEESTEISVTKNGNGTYSFVMPANAVEVQVTFKVKTVVAPSGSSSNPTYPVVADKSEAVDGTIGLSASNAKKGSTVTVTVTPDKYYGVEKVIVRDESGKEIQVTENADGTYSFKMPSGKVTVEAVYVWENPFVDVKEGTYYIDPVEWALKNDITAGTSKTTFSPNSSCTRAQMVTFLWNSAGRPEPSGDDCAFNDVSKDSYYEKAVRWAYENGITKGTSETTFSPDMECSRAHMATFLCQMADGKAESDTNAFVDVKSNAYYADSVQWAVENGITKGTGNNKYSPDATCTRGQMVTFLYQYYNK